MERSLNRHQWTIESIADGGQELPSPVESSPANAYHATLTRGLCAALLAASVVDSSLVTKRGTADMRAVSADSGTFQPAGRT